MKLTKSDPDFRLSNLAKALSGFSGVRRSVPLNVFEHDPSEDEPDKK